MIADEKILITGPAGKIAFPLAERLSRDNEVWGIARFNSPASREEVESAGVRTLSVDLEMADFSGLPRDFTYVLHIAAHMDADDDYDRAIRVNAEGTGLLLSHCRNAKAALVMSTVVVYRPSEDPLHAYVEDDPLGDANQPDRPAYSVSKIAQEAVARFCAREFGLPVVIARMNAAYGIRGGTPTRYIREVSEGKRVTARWDPLYFSPIHEEDIYLQCEAMLQAASVPANIVNWGGDEPVSVREWVEFVGEMTGSVPPLEIIEQDKPGFRGLILSSEKRRSLTGPCRVGWREGFRRVHQALYGSPAARD